MTVDNEVENSSELGKVSVYDSSYNPNRLFAIPRISKRLDLGIDSPNLPFVGFDLWNHYEVSWLNMRGKPISAVARIKYACDSPNIIESKSLKLYFNSLNNTKFKDRDMVESTVIKDLEEKIKSRVEVAISPLEYNNLEKLDNYFIGESIDDLDIDCDEYMVNPGFLQTEDIDAEETLYSDLLKSNCPVTNQPDWGSVQIYYSGKKIDHAGLLRYIVSYRNYTEFHEQCIERIFVDIMKHCVPKKLAIYGRYTRRGGIDINPLRATDSKDYISTMVRLLRQ